jgi:hypothetical protein
MTTLSKICSCIAFFAFYSAKSMSAAEYALHRKELTKNNIKYTFVTADNESISYRFKKLAADKEMPNYYLSLKQEGVSEKIGTLSTFNSHSFIWCQGFKKILLTEQSPEILAPFKMDSLLFTFTQQDNVFCAKDVENRTFRMQQNPSPEPFKTSWKILIEPEIEELNAWPKELFMAAAEYLTVKHSMTKVPHIRPTIASICDRSHSFSSDELVKVEPWLPTPAQLEEMQKLDKADRQRKQKQCLVM